MKKEKNIRILTNLDHISKEIYGLTEVMEVLNFLSIFSWQSLLDGLNVNAAIKSIQGGSFMGIQNKTSTTYGYSDYYLKFTRLGKVMMVIATLFCSVHWIASDVLILVLS